MVTPDPIRLPTVDEPAATLRLPPFEYTVYPSAPDAWIIRRTGEPIYRAELRLNGDLYEITTTEPSGGTGETFGDICKRFLIAQSS